MADRMYEDENVKKKEGKIEKTKGESKKESRRERQGGEDNRKH